MAIFTLCCLSCARTGPPATADKTRLLEQGPDVTVRIFRQFTFSEMQVDIDPGRMFLQADDDAPLVLPANERRLLILLQDGHLTCNAGPAAAAADSPYPYSGIKIKTSSPGSVWFKITIPELGIRRDYEGTELDLSVKYGNLALINHLPLELYLARVLPAEMDPDHFTSEVLKAQAVVARTWALKNLSRHRRFGYNFCDSTHCQVYKGRRCASLRAERAVAQTLGEVIMVQGRLAEAFYHSTCGGNTVFIRDVWGVPALPYLSRVEDYWQPGRRPYCAHSPYARWRILTSLPRLQRQLRSDEVLAPEEKLQAVKTDFVNLSGRTERILLVTDRRWRRLDVDAFRRLLNQPYARPKMISNFFDLNQEGQTLSIQGKGLGHGVGLCQWGARGMAQHGFGYREILLHYFRGTQISPAYGAAAAAGAEAAATRKSSTRIK